MPSKEDSSLREANLPLLEHHSLTDERDEQDQKLLPRFWIESKKLWHIVGPSIFSRVASYSMFVISQAFAGLLVGHGKCLGNAMWASLWSKKVLHVRRLLAAFVDRSFHLLYLAFASVLICLAGVEAVGAAR
ncbi:hypothetical protein V8G54_016434 [Vigna mungo]|uniref:Uncharacterized protein n=1 Tax=Vigna mungo TaxID=3915 RepID=A0AAQ3RXV0_VIGMU